MSGLVLGTTRGPSRGRRKSKRRKLRGFRGGRCDRIWCVGGACGGRGIWRSFWCSEWVVGWFSEGRLVIWVYLECFSCNPNSLSCYFLEL